MTKTKFTTLTLLLVLTNTILSAETKQQKTQQPCSTSVECDAMAKDLQGKINVLERKGIENLTDDEFDNLDTLQDQLLTVKNVQVAQTSEKLAQAKAKTAQQRKIIAQKDAEIAEEKAKQAELRRSQDKKLEEIGTLLKK